MTRAATSAPSPRNVWVVHGRDLDAKHAMFNLLRAIGLEPLEWDDVADKTGKAAPSVDEVVTQGFEQAHAVVVLLTPDEDARLRSPFLESSEDPELDGQPRPNVLYEAGMAMGINPKRTVLVELGKTRVVSDIAGLLRVRIEPTAASLDRLVRRLRAAGCAVRDPAPTVAELERLAGHFPDPERFSGQIELAVRVPPGSAVDDKQIYVATSLDQLRDGRRSWQPFAMERDDDEHWRSTLIGPDGATAEYKYVLAPPESWEIYQGDMLRNRRLRLQRLRRVQHDVVEQWG